MPIKNGYLPIIPRCIIYRFYVLPHCITTYTFMVICYGFLLAVLKHLA